MKESSARHTRVQGGASGRPVVSAVSGILELQRLAGNRAVSQLIGSHAETQPRSAPDIAVQRAVILLDVTPHDYALQKVLVGLEPSTLTMLDKAGDVLPGVQPPFLIPYNALIWVAQAAFKKQIPLLENDEDIHVVGHGGYGGRVWTAPDHGREVTDFSNLAGSVKKIAPADWAGSVKFRTCYSEGGDADEPSVVEKTKKALGHERVEGSAGFAYGMGKHLPGQSKVLAPAYVALYKADKYNEGVAEHLRVMASRRAVVREKIPVTKADTLDPKKVWDAFVARMKELESEMKTIVHSDAYAGLKSLERARALAANDQFNAAVKAQYELFEAFKLWS